MVNCKLRTPSLLYALRASAREVAIHNLLFTSQPLCPPRPPYLVLPVPPYIWGP
jgi:hypothetical protein